MSTAPRNRYRADLREIEFQLFEQAKLGQLLGQEPFANWGREEIKMVLEGARQFAYDVTGPLNGVGDAGCTVEDGRVITPPGFKDAWKQIYELGFKTLAVPEEYGGQNGPHALQAVIEEILSGSNTALNMYPGLAFGAAEVIALVGTQTQKDLFLTRMLDGTWGGTMCLTEPQAGSDVGAATSKAVRQPDGRFKITGTKIFISGGDHDLAENIIHLVLARIEGAPEGTKGLSLFIVPRVRINEEDGSLQEWNDVTLGGIEHKMGINGSATCVLNFGENDDCYGRLVGGVEHEGIKQMFLMMNTARLAVGIQGLGIASSAYLSALDYARERKQGPSIENFKDPTAPKVAIIKHPDIRRSLLEMKARVEGVRAVVVKLAAHNDFVHALQGKDDEQVAYHKGQIELLTPIVKAYGSDQSFRVCEIAVQVHGGAGYIRDYGVEQDLRDSKIFSIYEGTNHIQAMDLVGRKLGQKGGANMQAFVQDVQNFVDAHREHPALASDVEKLGSALEALVGGAMRFMGWAGESQLSLVSLNANRYLEMFSEVVVGWQLLAGASIAHEALAGGSTEKAFYEGKIQAGHWFARNVLPTVAIKGELMGSDDESPMEIGDESFATV